jgi:ubiquinone/menaquinone biosynthesis C-methylase UbiE
MSHDEVPPDGDRDVDGVRRGYDRWAPVYDSQRNATRDLDAEVVRRSGIELAGAAVLELGCGTGKNTVWLAERARWVVAVDFSSGMLSEARRRVTAANVEFVTHDIREPWPVNDGSIDLVACNLVLEHVKELAPIFQESSRVLAAGGELLICELHPYRQLSGAQAQYLDPATGSAVPVPAFLHSISDFVNGGIDAGLELRRMAEVADSTAPPGAPPRLLTMRFARA